MGAGQKIGKEGNAAKLIRRADINVNISLCCNIATDAKSLTWHFAEHTSLPRLCHKERAC